MKLLGKVTNIGIFNCFIIMISNIMNINEMQIRPPSRFVWLARTLCTCLSKGAVSAISSITLAHYCCHYHVIGVRLTSQSASEKHNHEKKADISLRTSCTSQKMSAMFDNHTLF